MTALENRVTVHARGEERPIVPPVGESRGESMRERERAACAAFRAQRIRAGMSQADMADRMQRLGFSLNQSGIAKLEAGRRPIRYSEMLGLADALGMPLRAVLDDSSDVDMPGGGSDDLARELVEADETRARALAEGVESIREWAARLAMAEVRAEVLREAIRAGAARAARR